MSENMSPIVESGSKVLTKNARFWSEDQENGHFCLVQKKLIDKSRRKMIIFEEKASHKATTIDFQDDAS